MMTEEGYDQWHKDFFRDANFQGVTNLNAEETEDEVDKDIQREMKKTAKKLDVRWPGTSWK